MLALALSLCLSDDSVKRTAKWFSFLISPHTHAGLRTKPMRRPTVCPTTYMTYSGLFLSLHPVKKIVFLKVYYSSNGCIHLFLFNKSHKSFMLLLLYRCACVHVCVCLCIHRPHCDSSKKGVSAGVLAYVLMPQAKWLATSQNTHSQLLFLSISLTLFLSLGFLTFLLLAPRVYLRDSWTDTSVLLCKRSFKCLWGDEMTVCHTYWTL